MSGRQDGKVAVVTGVASTRGIGWAIARQLAMEGARLMVTDVRGAAAEECAATLRDQGFAAIGMQHDVTREEDWQSIIARTIEEFGRLDILVNNAGVAELARVDEMPSAVFRRQLDINLTGAFLGCAAAIPEMRRQNGGAIVNISSVAGLVGFPAAAGYSASKGGLRMMTKSIAMEVAAENIRCNSVHPGAISTDMLGSVSVNDVARHQAIIATIPMRRVGAPEDIARCVAYLASDDAAYVTGSEFVVDGGQVAQ